MKAKSSSKRNRSCDRKGGGLADGKARKGAGAGVVLAGLPGCGPWDGVIDPERGNTCVRRLMKWYRQRLGLSLHQVEALTGINRAHLRRVERRRIHLSLTVLWRWCNGLRVNVDWVLKLARRQAREAGLMPAADAAQDGGSLRAPCASPAGVAECAHDSAVSAADPAASAPPGPDAAAGGKAGAEAPEKSFPAGREGAGGAENSFPEDAHFAHPPEKSSARSGESPPGLEKSFPKGIHFAQPLEKSSAGSGESPLGAEKSFPRSGESPLGAEKSLARSGESPLGPKKSPAPLPDMVFPPQDYWL